MGFLKESIILAVDGVEALNKITEDIISKEPSEKLISLIIADENIPHICGQ